MKNTSLRKTLLTSVLAIILCLLAIVQIFTIERGVAHGESNTTNLEKLCEEYTKDVLLTGESKGGLTIKNYESYVNTQFDITNRNNLNAGITDEWIFRIIPKELAEQKKTQYLYVGEKYGFYFDYNSDSNTFFVYLMLHDSDYSVSGHLGRKITPLYYEKYGYNRENKSAALEYKSYHYINTGLVEHYYQKYSDTKKVYLKNVAFSGTLINSNNYNIDEVGYQSATDNGGYFIGGSYKFKGVSTQAEKTDFTADLFKLAIGKIPLTAGLEVGDILTIADMTNSLIEHVKNDNFDFRKVITNENDYSFDLTEIDRDKQIEKFGTLLKDYIFTLDTPDTKDGVLFGIHGEINYAENTFYFNFADQTNKWNTQFAGRIQMDIVEENGNLIGATVNTIASDVESNAYESNIYEDNRLLLEESSTKSAYVLGGKTQPIRFVAPANGVYTIETFGTVQNAFVDTKGEVPIKTDGINQKLKLRLEKGEIFDFKTENLSSSREVYQIKAELTPTEIAVGEAQSVTVKPGETEYLAYYSDSNSGINYSFNKKGNYFSSVYLNNFNNQINSTSNENKVSNAISQSVIGGKYLFGIKNEGDGDLTIELSISLPQELTEGKQEKLMLGHGGISRISSGKGPMPTRIIMVSSSPIKGILYDDTGTVYSTETALNFSILYELEENKTYYLYVSGQNEYDVEIMYMVADNPIALKLGENSISKLNEKVTVKFDCKATARYYLSSGQASMIVYTKQWEEVSAMNGYYEFFANNIYYVVLGGAINDFNLSLNFDYTENLSDRFNEKGYKYVKFVPEVADVYSVSGVTKYTWYYNALMQNYGKLTENETYFVRIEGTPNANYNISIARRVITLQLSTIQSVSSGLYGIAINEPGSYSIMTSKGNDIIANYNILNLQRQILHENISAGGVYSIFLESSIILEFTVNGTSSIGIRVNNINSVDESRNINLIEGVEQEVKFYKNTDNNFTFTSSATAEYYFKFAYATTSTTFIIVVTDSDLNLVATEALLIEPFANDTLVKKYGIKLNLEENTRYFFNICFYNALSSSITATALISRPSIISDVTMNSSDGFRSTKIISERLSLTEINIAMGLTYTFNAPGSNAVYWRVAASTPKYLYNVDGDTITIILNKSYENYMIYINFIDDTEEILTVGLKLKLPIYLAPSYAESYNKYLIWYLNENGQPSSDFNCAENAVVYLGNYLLTADSNSLSTFDYMDKEWNTIYCTVWFNVNGYEYNLTSDVINVNRSKVYLTSVTEQLQGEGHIIIDARDSYVSDRTIIVPTRVTSVVYIGSSTVLTNIKFKFEQHNTFKLFLKNYKTISTTNTAVLDLAQVDNISIWLSGDNSIKGVSSSYLIEAKKVVFSGNGNLSVIGNHGGNGTDGVDQVASDFGERGRDGGDGTNGRDGVGALKCTSLSNKESASIILRGGDGGDGGRGGNGGKGGPGQSYIQYTQRAGDGGNGGKGGDGGNRAKGCNKETENITIMHGFAGRGGDGGKGGDGGNAANGGITIYNYQMSASESGNGGNGGNAGYTGWGDLKPNVSNPRGGNGGNGGKGGNGAGYTYQDNKVNTYLFVDAKNGGHGGNGGKGYYGGIGGRGGSGGTGAKGRDYSFGIVAQSGYKGGDGGNGGNGGDSISSVSDVGQGGSGGGGGSGGAPGQILFTSISKATYGPVGSKGQDGVYGVFVEEERPIEPACVAEGTLITLADGRQVPVESLKGNEMLLVWNLFTGKFDVAPILFIDSDPAKMYKVINLYFSDGTSVKVISEHGFWDFDLNEYVFLREDAAKYVGHWFNKQTTDENGNLSYTRVQLTGVVVQEEYTTAWSPVTYGHLCYYVNGMLSMPGATTGLINIFDVDAYTMKIIETAYDTDIAQYGLFTYDEFANIFPVSEVVFEAFGGQYLKVAIGKGILTYDMLEELINRYAVFFDTTQID